MADVLDLLGSIEKIDIRKIAERVLTDNESVIADLNATQMSMGKRSDGTDILPSYRPLTVELKQGKSGLAGVTDRVTLFDSGDHYRGLYADVKGEEMEYGSKDEKSAKLQKKYDTAKGSIYGLNDDSREDLVNGYVQGDTQDEIERITGLKFS